jgi:hypothetical protein
LQGPRMKNASPKKEGFIHQVGKTLDRAVKFQYQLLLHRILPLDDIFQEILL